MLLLSLVKQAQNSDEKALIQILEMFEPKIKKTLRMTNRNVRDDIRQEIFFRLIRAIQSYNVDHIPDIWFFLGDSPSKRKSP
ncbi:helix-turn-helix domain-containing protein [Brevibacillus thermoruber]|jgi:DNA-directed RNA polymerase specialized sigma24 family protein|uniref:helix-turn-helix domain-containing protein n=1 Tax=Brevibacillus thermoruber TaxID=33942 RepID=UPI00404237E9